MSRLAVFQHISGIKPFWCSVAKATKTINDTINTYNMYAKYVALVELLFELFLINQYTILQSHVRRITYS